MRVIITGICGFAGNLIARGLLEHLSGIQITGLDSLIRKGAESNLQPLRDLGMDVRIGDIRDAAAIEALPDADWVIDCAANPSVLAGVADATSPKELLDHNLGGTIHLLEFCRKRKAGFLLLSTSRVYSLAPLAGLGMKVRNDAFVPSAELPGMSRSGLREDFSTEPPLSLYGSSKKCSELLALEYGMAFGFPVRINRCGVLAGAGQFGKADQGIFSYWIHSWAQRRPLKYIGFDGSGYQVRDCLHPRDIVGLLARQISEPDHPAPPIVNLSGGCAGAMSLYQLSAWCAERFGQHVVASDPRPRPFDLPWLILDSSLAETTWGWKATTPIHSILEEVANQAMAMPGWLDFVS